MNTLEDNYMEDITIRNEPLTELGGSGLNVNELIQGNNVILDTYFNEDKLQESREKSGETNEYSSDTDFSLAEMCGQACTFESDEESPATFDEMKLKMKDISPRSCPNSMFKKLVKHGHSLLPKNPFVTVNYNMYIDGVDEPVDSSHLRNCPLQFLLGPDADVIEGLVIAVSTMKIGEKSNFLISPELAFGALGCPNRIPANATVLFTIILVAAIEHPDKEVMNLSTSEFRELEFEDVMKSAKNMIDLGNQQYKSNNIKQASLKYKEAENTLVKLASPDGESEVRKISYLCRAQLNSALCFLSQDRYNSALNCLNDVLYYSPSNPKAIFLKAKCFMGKGQLDVAKKHLLKAQKLKSNSKDIANLLQELESRYADDSYTERELCKKMFQNFNIPSKSLEKTFSALQDKDKYEKIVVNFKTSKEHSVTIPLVNSSNLLVSFLEHLVKRENLVSAIRGESFHQHMVISKPLRS